jgi:hypothetical protein
MTRLGKDEGKYNFPQWETQLTLPSAGRYALMARCLPRHADAGLC